MHSGENDKPMGPDGLTYEAKKQATPSGMENEQAAEL
jgi:hypothetical protein